MKKRPFAILGVLFILTGVATMVHPQFQKHVSQEELQVGSSKTIIETTRIIAIPRVLSGFAILAGGVLLFLSPRKL